MTLPFHHAFTIKYGYLARELKTNCEIIDPFSTPNNSTSTTQCIWDTGATNSVINLDIAKRLGLKPTGMVECMGVHGKEIVPTFVVHIKLPNNVTFRDVPVTGNAMGSLTDVLIGMDIIGAGEMTVSLVGGRTYFSFCIPSFQNHHDLVEKADIINPRNQKKNLKNR